MSRTRLAALAAMLSCALMLVGGTGIASAQTASTQKLAKTIKVTGTTTSGKKMRARYTIDRFIAKGNKTYALGTLRGTVGGRRFVKRHVKMRVAQSTGSASAAQATSCQVLDLVINPITL